jgi:hypothetical protein
VKIYREVTIRVSDQGICNKCGQIITYSTDPHISTTIQGTYFSKILEDEETKSFDLCEECVCKLIEEFLIPAETYNAD